MNNETHHHTTSAMLDSIQEDLTERIEDMLAEEETILKTMVGTFRQIDDDIAEKMAAAAMAEYARTIQFYGIITKPLNNG